MKTKEKGKVNDEALRLIVKISEGSVRDALSLLDRALLSQSENQELNLKEAQKIFGYFDKSYLIDLFKFLFNGNEKEVINIYRSIYSQGIEPKVFLNDFLEILYYIKNISSIKLGGNNFSLNDNEYKKIENLSKNISPDIVLLFWQYAIKTMNELEIVSNQNLSMEMFLIRLLYLKNEEVLIEKNNSNLNNDQNLNDNKETPIKSISDEESKDIKNKTISQIKNFSQEDSSNPYTKPNMELKKIEIHNFNELIKLCNQKKELKLKYELETNVNLVSFIDQRIEVSFNENLDKDFVKDLSLKLNEWTGKRWIIAFSKKEGQLSKKSKKEFEKSNLIDEEKRGEDFKKVLEILPDAELIDIKLNDENK